MAYICISGNIFLLSIFSNIPFHSVPGGVSRLLTLLIGTEQGEVLPPHFIQITEIWELLSVTDEPRELKQLVPLVRFQEATAARYDCDDTTMQNWVKHTVTLKYNVNHSFYWRNLIQ